ncbi:porin [Zhongshania sp. BJYM1]|uniref:porin n=1 Tax=Zhongshania aquatica TaxID=2965069 RepID=UPI0022B4E775|nr:porin [Marortus sp. BJYM1]
MKTVLSKSALVVSILAAAGQAFAQSEPDLDLYASFRIGIDSVDAGTSDDGANGRDYLSRIGVKGSMDLGDGLTGLAQLEYGLRSDNLVDVEQNEGPTMRLMMVGLKGDWGTVYYGSQTLVWHKFVRGSYFSDGYDSVRQGTIRDDDLLQYYYQAGDFTLGLGVQMEGQDGDSFDQFQIGGEYKAGPVTLQAAYLKDNRGDNTGGLLGLRAWWKVTDSFTLSAYSHRADEDFDLYGTSTGNVRLREAEIEGNKNGINSCITEESSSNGIYGQYVFGKNKIHARYAIDTCDISGDVDSVKLEYVRSLGKNYSVWLSYEDLKNDIGRKPTTSSGDDMSELQLGVRADF